MLRLTLLCLFVSRTSCRPKQITWCDFLGFSPRFPVFANQPICCHGFLWNAEDKGERRQRLAICPLTTIAICIYILKDLFPIYFCDFIHPLRNVHRHLCSFLKTWSDVIAEMDPGKQMLYLQAYGQWKVNLTLHSVQRIIECIFCLRSTVDPWWCAFVKRNMSHQVW